MSCQWPPGDNIETRAMDKIYVNSERWYLPTTEAPSVEQVTTESGVTAGFSAPHALIVEVQVQNVTNPRRRRDTRGNVNSLFLNHFYSIRIFHEQI